MSGTAGALALAGFAWLTLFQLLLAAGLPLGRMAWGGAHRVLPRGLRLASLASAGLAGLGVAAAAQASGLATTGLPEVVLRPLFASFALLFGLSLIGNAASSSRVERLHGVPLTILLAGCSAVLASG